MCRLEPLLHQLQHVAQVAFVFLEPLPIRPLLSLRHLHPHPSRPLQQLPSPSAAHALLPPPRLQDQQLKKRRPAHSRHMQQPLPPQQVQFALTPAALPVPARPQPSRLN
jgi:hypothetical protein